MPNWCENKLAVYGPTETVLKFHSYGLDFNKLYPQPDNVDEYETDMPGWWNWRCKNWGTKWGASNLASYRGSTLDEDAEFSYQFQTAWAPPIALLKNITKSWPTLEFYLRYEEPGVGFAGAFRILNGRILLDNEMNI